MSNAGSLGRKPTKEISIMSSQVLKKNLGLKSIHNPQSETHRDEIFCSLGILRFDEPFVKSLLHFTFSVAHFSRGIIFNFICGLLKNKTKQKVSL